MYHLDITKKQISDVFKISDVTISKTYRRIHPFHKIVMSNTITELVLQKRNSIPKKKLEINEENLVVSDEEKKLKVAKKKTRGKSKTKKNDKLLTESEESSDESDIEV